MVLGVVILHANRKEQSPCSKVDSCSASQEIRRFYETEDLLKCSQNAATELYVGPL